MEDVLSNAARDGACSASLMATFFAPSRNLTVCNAGHPPPLLFRHATGEWSILPTRESPPSGIDSPELLSADSYQHGSVELGLRDMVLFYSESLLECRGPTGGPTSVSCLLSRLRKLDAGHPERLASDLLDSLASDAHENLQGSDSNVVLLRHNSRRPAWQDNLLAPLRLLREVRDRTSLS